MLPLAAFHFLAFRLNKLMGKAFYQIYILAISKNCLPNKAFVLITNFLALGHSSLCTWQVQ